MSHSERHNARGGNHCKKNCPRLHLTPFRLVLALFFLLAWHPAIRAGNWSSVGPQGSTPRRFALPPNASSYVQFSATMRTLFGRTEGGDWIPISPDYGGFTTWNIDDIAIAPSDPARIYLLRTGPYAGTEIYRTHDEGLSWDTISLPIPAYEHFVYSLAIHPEHPDTMFAASFVSLFRSVDGGDNWEDLGASFQAEPITTDIIIRSDDPSVIIAGARGDYPGIFQSLDLGETWDWVFSDAHIAQLVASPDDPLVFYARSEGIIHTSEIYRSSDGGTNWSLWSDDPRLTDNLAVDPNDGQRMYILGYDAETSGSLLLGSLDAGQTWNVITTSQDLESSNPVSMGVSPDSGGGPATLYLGTSFRGVYRSFDDGNSWQPERFHAAYMGSIAHDPLQAGRIYMGTAAAMNQSLANGRLHVSEDGGSSWSYSGESDEPTQPVGRVFALLPSPTVPDRAWVGTSYGLFLSNDAGRTLTHTGNGLVRSIWEDPSDVDHLIFGTAAAPTYPPTPPRLFETTDGGEVWNELRQFEQAVLDIEVDAADGRVYCALGVLNMNGLSGPGAGGLFWMDSGADWTESPSLSGMHVSAIIVDPDSPGRLYASTMDQGVFTSTDRGMSWTTMNNGLVSTEVHALEAIDLSGTREDLIAGTWNGTSRWTGDTWMPLNEGMVTFPSGGDSIALQTTALDYDPEAEAMYVGSSGRSAYRLDLAPTGIGGDNTVWRAGVPRAFSLSQNYPNPFNPTTTIAFDISDTGGSERSADAPGDSPADLETRRHTTLTVFDLRGRRQRRLIESNLEPGSYLVQWNGRNDRGDMVASGIYLYTLRSGDQTLTRKMTIIR